MRKITQLALMLTLAFVPAVVSAQWSPISTPTNASGQYWDNPSNDGRNCNIGFIVLNSTSPCNNQRPTGWLMTGIGQPLSPNGEYRTTSGFPLFSNTLAVLSLYGDVAGQNRNWGWFTTDGTFVNLNGLGQNTPVTIGTTNGSWGLWADLTNGTRELSTGNQFAFFRQSTVQNKYTFGIEDISVSSVSSDRDYNDVVGSLTTVPEPSTYLLMAVGLAGFFVIRKRINA